MADLLYVNVRELDFLRGPNVVKDFNKFCEDLLVRPLLSSRCRGSWDRETTRKLTKKESKEEVGWLFKNAEMDIKKLSVLTSSNLICWYDERCWQEHLLKQKSMQSRPLYAIIKEGVI